MNLAEIFLPTAFVVSLHKGPKQLSSAPPNLSPISSTPNHIILSHSLPMTTFLTIKLVCRLLSMHKLHSGEHSFFVMLKYMQNGVLKAYPNVCLWLHVPTMKLKNSKIRPQ